MLLNEERRRKNPCNLEINSWFWCNRWLFAESLCSTTTSIRIPNGTRTIKTKCFYSTTHIRVMSCRKPTIECDLIKKSKQWEPNVIIVFGCWCIRYLQCVCYLKILINGHNLHWTTTEIIYQYDALQTNTVWMPENGFCVAWILNWNYIYIYLL